MTVDLGTVREAVTAGICVVPPAEDGSKRPDGDWKRYQQQRPDARQIGAWFEHGRDGIGFICGKVSGGLEMLEFEGRAVADGMLTAYEEAAQAAGIGDVLERIAQGYMEATPSGGIHLIYRCDTPLGNTKLARRPATPDELEDNADDRIKVLVETRGEGGYVIVAPSHGHVHPSGQAWTQIHGGVGTIQTITDEQRDALFELARAFDAMPVPQWQPSTPTYRTSEGDGPADHYNAAATWPELLEPAGWVRVYQRDQVTYWRRPGKPDGISASTNHGGHDLLHVFTSSSVFEPERSYTKFHAYGILHHAGDLKAAGKALYHEGYGTRREPAKPKQRDANNNTWEPPRDHDDTPPPDTTDILRPFRRVDVNLLTPLPPTPVLPPWLYGGGCLTVLQSEPGVGKSWLALWIATYVMEQGGDVVYIDEEGGLELVHERLNALGVPADLVSQHFWYYAFEMRTWGEQDMLALTAMLAGIPQPTLAVLDSLPDFLAVADQDEDRAKDVTRFIKKVCGAFREIGCSQLLLDHLPKPQAGTKNQRSRYSRGSGSKLGKADATLLLEAETEFDVRTNGTLKLWKTKDRRGRLDLPPLGKTGLTLAVLVGEGRLSITQVVTASDEHRGEQKPTILMERLSLALEGRTDTVTQNALLSIVGGNKEWKKKALEHLIADGYVQREKHGQAFQLTSIVAYRQPVGDSTENNDSW